jgi:Uncharacterised ACR (DUF711)
VPRCRPTWVPVRVFSKNPVGAKTNLSVDRGATLPVRHHRHTLGDTLPPIDVTSILKTRLSRNQLGFEQRATEPPLVSFCSSAQTMTQNEAAPVVVTMGSTASTDEDMKPIMVVRTVTAFLTLRPEHFDVSWGSLFSPEDLDAKVAKCVNLLREVESQLQANRYTVQTIRIATNPFGEWMTVGAGGTTATQSAKKKAKVDAMSRLERLDA